MASATDEADLLSVVGQIYETAIDPTAWPAALKSIGGLICTENMALASQDANLTSGSVHYTTGWDASAVEAYPHYASKDITFHDGARRPTGTAYRDQMFPDQSLLTRSEFYNDFMVPWKVHHAMGVFMQHDERRIAALSCYRSRNVGSYSEPEAAVLSRLAPHLLRAIQLRRQFALLDLQRHAFCDAINHLRLAAVVVNQDSHIVSINGAGEALMRKRDGFVVAGPMLSVQSVAEVKTLQGLIHGAASLDDDRRTSGGVLRVSRPSGRRSYHVLVSPLPKRDLGLGMNANLAVVFIDDPDRSTGISSDHLERLFGFTEAEAAVASGLLEGRSIATIAAERGVSLFTVRHQLQSLFTKTGTKRQGELVSLLMRIPAIG